MAGTPGAAIFQHPPRGKLKVWKLKKERAGVRDMLITGRIVKTVATTKKLGFQVRIKEQVGLKELAERVSKALGSPFLAGRGQRFRDGEDVLLAEALGLLIELGTDPEYLEEPPQGPWTYFLLGSVHERLSAEWPADAPTVSITPYMLHLLHSLDSEAWFAPSRAELLAEAGIIPDSEG